MRKNLENIEIVEPPIQELTKKRHGLLKACLTSCLIIILLFIGAAFALKFSLGPGPKTIKQLPANFPADIPIYDRDNIETMTFVSGRYKNRGVEVAAFFPKLILSPLLARLAPDSQNNIEQTNDQVSLSGIWKVITTPVVDAHDTVEIQWTDLDTAPTFLISYYKKELEKKNFSIDTQSEGKYFRQISFSRADGISGSLLVNWIDADKTRTQSAMLTINTNSDLSSNSGL